MVIRDAVDGDFEQITAIYNDVLIHSTAIYSDRPSTVEERRAWGQARRDQGYPLIVAVEGDRVAGFASFGDFRAWPGYRFTVEGTIHIHAEARGQGLGTALLQSIIVLARDLGKHSMIAGVDAENSVSLGFLERFGFARVGHLREVGFKFDRYLDLVLLQYWLTPPVGT